MCFDHASNNDVIEKVEACSLERRIPQRVQLITRVSDWGGPCVCNEGEEEEGLGSVAGLLLCYLDEVSAVHRVKEQNNEHMIVTPCHMFELCFLCTANALLKQQQKKIHPTVDSFLVL